jgi:GNAT superfamily N-acetyltransferase
LNGVEAIERISRECFRGFGRLPSARLIDDGRVFGVLSDVPINFFSGIAMSNLSIEEVPRVLDTMRSRPFRWWISPSTRPADLAAILASTGLHHTYDAVGMVVELDSVDFGAPLPSGFTIRRVTDLSDWETVFMEGFERPESDRGVWRAAYSHCDDVWAHFVGYLDGAPVATTSLLLCKDLAGIYHVVTLPAARGRGVGRAITVAALRYAREMGATHAALQSSEMGFRVYRAIGFVPYCDLTLYDWRPARPAALLAPPYGTS